MKKAIALILCLVIVLSVTVGCAPQEAPATEPQTVQHSLKVGYGRRDITPDLTKYPVEMGGYFGTRPATSVTVPLYATCIAISDAQDNTVLLYHLDMLKCYDQILYAKSAISKATGVPAKQIITATTHAHSTPSLDVESPTTEAYADQLKTWMVEAAQDAMADRKEAKLFTTTVHPQGLNYVRHYVLADGTIGGDNFGTPGQAAVSHVSQADNAMQLIKFTREGGKDVILVNWQGHPHRDGGSSKNNLSSDIVGILRRELEANLDCQFAYFTGASGNVNNHTRLKAERITSNCEEHGKALAQYVLDAKDYTQREMGYVQCSSEYFPLQTQMNIANDMNLTVMSIGDVAFIAAPYEMFDTNGLEIKNGSPFAMTFISTCTNGGNGYIPSIATYAYKQYDVYEIRGCGYIEGTGEILSQKYVSMLTAIYDTRK